MTNEELAAQAKAGDRDALAQLWEQNTATLDQSERSGHLQRETSQRHRPTFSGSVPYWHFEINHKK